MADASAPTRKCPECGEVLKPDASLCRHCGFAFGTAAPAGSPPGGPKTAQASVWETIELIFPLRKIALVAGAVVFCLLLVLILSKYGGSMANRQSDAEFTAQTQRTLPAAQQVVAEDGICTIRFAMPAPADRTSVQEVADRVAGSYQKFRAARGLAGPVTILIYYNQTLAAKVVKQ